MNRTRKTIVFFLLVSALLLSFAFASSASAGPIAEKKARLKVVMAKLQGIYHESDVAVEKYNQAKSKLDGVRAQIKRNEQQLKVAEYNLGVANEQLARRAENIYKSRDVGLMDVVFAASSFDDLVTQMDVMTRLGNSDVDTVRSIDAYRGDIKDRRVKLDADKKAAAGLVVTAATQKRQIIGLKAKYEQMTAGIKGDIKRLQAQANAAAQRAAAAASTNSSSSSSSSSSSGGSVVADPGGPGHPEVANYAAQFVNRVPYVWGGASPSGFDCSGLTMYCYQHAAGISLAHGATAQQQASTPVPLSALLPGDLVFFGSAGFSSHVAISLGGSGIIDASSSNGKVVRRSYWTFGSDPAWIGGRF